MTYQNRLSPLSLLSHLAFALQQVNEVLLISRGSTGESTATAAVHDASLLFGNGEIHELLSGVGLIADFFIFFEDADLASDRLGSFLVVPSDHDDADTGFTAQGDGGLDLHTTQAVKQSGMKLEILTLLYHKPVNVLPAYS